MHTNFNPGDRAFVYMTARPVRVVAQDGDTVLVKSPYGQTTYRPEQLRLSAASCALPN